MFGMYRAAEVFRGVFKGFAAAAFRDPVPQCLWHRWWTGRRRFWRYLVRFRNVHFLAFDDAFAGRQTPTPALFKSVIKTMFC
jgi:hypothetical protein